MEVIKCDRILGMVKAVHSKSFSFLIYVMSVRQNNFHFLNYAAFLVEIFFGVLSTRKIVDCREKVTKNVLTLRRRRQNLKKKQLFFSKMEIHFEKFNLSTFPVL